MNGIFLFFWLTCFIYLSLPESKKKTVSETIYIFITNFKQ